MYWLSLDLSSPTGTIAVHAPGSPHPSLIAQATVSREFHHSERLLGVLERLLGEQKLSLADMDRFVTTQGPGSFTGLRIALATLKAFGLTLAHPLETLNGSEARGICWLRAQPETKAARVLVVTQATTERLVWGIFEKSDGWHFTTEHVGNPAELKEAAEGAILLLDDQCPDRWLSNAGAERFPLRAEHLGASLMESRTRQTFTTPAELIAAAPRYYGETQYTESQPRV